LKIFHTPTRNETFQKRIAPLIISLTLFFSLVIIALTPPATGYELSIYEAYPTILWMLLAINIFFSFYTIIQSFKNQSKTLYLGYFSILFVETILFFLPIMRGYYSIFRGPEDVYYHMFVASQILNSGYLPLTDFYPMMHIWLSILYNFIPYMNILPIIFSIAFIILYVLSLYILGKTILDKKGGILFSLFGLPLIFYVNYDFYPFLFAVLIIPLILYAYQKIILNPKQKSSLYICMLFLSLFIVFCHPMIAVFLLIMFSIFLFFELIKKWVSSGQSNIESANIMIIIFLTLTLWWLQFRDITNLLQEMASAFLGEASHLSIVAYQTNAIKTSNVSIVLVIDRLIKIYGPIFLYFSISLIFVLFIIYKYFRTKKIYDVDFIYSTQFFVAIFIGIALLTGYFVIFEPIRAVVYGLLFATILCGFFFYRTWFSVPEKVQPGFIILLTLIITFVCMLTMLNMYPSPWIGGVNSALTYGDKNGNDWILEYRNAQTHIIKEELSNYKYSWYYFETSNTKNPQYVLEYNLIIPTHFGYNLNSTISDSFAYLPDKKAYMLTTERMKVSPYAVPIERRTLVKSFTDSDFIRLNGDPTVNLIYSGNEFGVWKIQGP